MATTTNLPCDIKCQNVLYFILKAGHRRYDGGSIYSQLAVFQLHHRIHDHIRLFGLGPLGQRFFSDGLKEWKEEEFSLSTTVF